jgi:two-component system, cell cycle sensor histidine kinase and response regulator CckA
MLDAGWGKPQATVLVVEDTEPIRKMVCAMLTQKGFSCLEAADGFEALRLMEDRDGVHLVLTDMMMPKMGGAELAERLARTRPDVRILFMSGYADDPQRSGAFLSKPFTASSLMEKVREVLHGPGFSPP